MRAVEENMRSDIRLQPDDERARLWLKRSLEWEQILGELRDAGRRDRPEPAPQRPAPGAA